MNFYFYRSELPDIIVSFPYCVCLEAQWSQIYEKILEHNLKFQENIYDELMKLKFFFEITSYPTLTKIKDLANYFNKETFSKNEVIPLKDKVYIIKTGRVTEFIDSNFIRTIETGSLIGDFFIVNTNTSNTNNTNNTNNMSSNKEIGKYDSVVSSCQLINKDGTLSSQNNQNNVNITNNNNNQDNTSYLDSYKIIAYTEVECYSISRTDFLNYFVTIDILKERLLVLNHLENQAIKQEELYFIENLGMGRFGNVRLVHNKKYYFAIKAINKKQTSKKKKRLLQYLLNEKLINQNLDHQFVVKFIKTMVKNDYIFFLMEYIEGITFKKLLERKNFKLSKNEIQFYAANILLILEYLNSRSVIHRDLKPDNLILGRTVK